MDWGDPAQLLTAVALGVAVTVFVGVVTHLVLAAADRLAQRTVSQRDDELLSKVGQPLRWLAPVVGVYIGAERLGIGAVTGGTWLIGNLIVTYVAVAAFEILVIESWLTTRQGIRVPPPVRQLAIAVIYGAVLLGLAGDVLGIDITPLLATGSVTTVVIGLALQGPLSNLFAGIVLHMDRHPELGQWVLVDGREGEVVEIGWRTTRIRTFTQDILVVPNAVLLNAQVVNFSQASAQNGRTIPVPVPLDLPPHVFDQLVRQALSGIPHVVEVDSPRTKTWLVAVDDHCLRYNVRFWVDHFRFHDDAESEFLKRLWYRFNEEGLAFPANFQAVRMVESPPAAMAGLDPKRPAAGFPPRTPG
jgi:small-conductance mechanosensitive channel